VRPYPSMCHRRPIIGRITTLSAKMRASICVLGPLIARCGAADVAVPGGDNIGSRGLDMHVDGLRKMGVLVTNEHGYLLAECQGLTGAHVALDFPSVGATETILMAAVTAKGESVIENAAREPEIIDICQMLVCSGGGYFWNRDIDTHRYRSRWAQANYTSRCCRPDCGRYLGSSCCDDTG